MKRKVAKLRLSPNEEARIIREEHERRRKLRIQQVREQQRHIALHIRREVERRRQRELEQLEEELREDWEQQQRDKLHTLQRLYEESLQLLGQGHRSAKENEPDFAAIAQREEENHVKAEERHREALKELKSRRLKDHERQSRSLHARKKALQAEKERSAKVASLPPPLPNPIQIIDSKKPHVVKKSDVSAFAATHYHMPESAVDREADTEQPNAHEGAELEGRRLQDVQREEMRRREEQLEKARLRGKEALKREHLVQDRERLLVELEHMQQTDLLRRRQQVSQMPPQIFQPLYQRQESREDYQREMEFAFEDMYTGERRVKGDLVVQLIPEPLPALSTGSQDQELDVTLDENATQEAGNAHRDTEQEAGSTEQETEGEPSRAAPRRALKKLLDRIRTQRTQWTDHNSCVPAADSPTAISDQIPERDSTIDTGSLTSEEKEPARSPPVRPALGTTKQRVAADPPLPDVLANRIKEFEEERKKREEELDREKQQQLVLLQELEEQKAKLEQMLLEAQQEREDLKAAVTRRVPVNQPQVPLHDQDVTSVTPVTEPVRPAGEDDHARRIKEYQQRLLERNRIHQRSVEVARQRLEEYQRALRIRHNMTSGRIHPHLHGAPSVHLPAPLQLPTAPAVSTYIHAKPQTPVEVPTRESDMLASSSRLPGSSAGVGSKLLPDESISSDPMNQRLDVTAWLTDNIMERVMEHLPERVRPSSEPLPYKLFTTHHSASTLLQPTSDPIQAVSPSITDGAPLVRGRAEAKRGSLRTGSLSSREDDDMERQRRELQEVQRRVLQQREAVVAAALQQQREAVALQQQREALQQQREPVLQQQREVLVLQQQREAVLQQQREVLALQQQQQQREAVALQQQQREPVLQQQREVLALQQQREALTLQQQREVLVLQQQREAVLQQQREVLALQQQQQQREAVALQQQQREPVLQQQREPVLQQQREVLALQQQREVLALQQQREALTLQQQREVLVLQQQREAVLQQQREAVALQQQREPVLQQQREVLALQLQQQQQQREAVALQQQREAVALQQQREAAALQQQREVLALQQQREATLQQQREATLQQQTEALALQQQREATLQQQREALQQQREALALQQQREATLQQQRKALALQQQREATLQQQREALTLQQQREATLQQQREATLQQQREALTLQQQREALALQQQREALTLQQQREAAALQQQREAAALQQQREATLQQQREPALQQQREATLQQQREALALQQQREALALQQQREATLQQQREAAALQQQRQQEEEKQRQEVEMEQMRWQKETLQALLDTDAQPAPEAAGEVLVSEDINQTRLELLVSLLRAIEESNGGTLSHLEEPQEKDGSPPQPPSNSGETDLISQSDVPAGPALASVLPSGLFPPPRAAKPPVSRARLGVMEMMTEQHELSAIQEVETPVNTSQVTGPEDTVTVPSHTPAWAQREDSESSVASDRTPQAPSWSSSEQWTAERSTGSGRRSGTSSPLVWRERQLMGADTSPESSESDSALRRISVLSSDSGRGADNYSGPAVTSYRSPTESAHRTPDSSTTISTGSYVTTDPEQNVNTDNSSPLRRGACLLEASSPSGQSSSNEDSSAAGRPGLAVDSLFSDSSIQNIIDRYTRELNISLSTAGKTTDSEGSYVEEPGSSVSQQSLAQVSERRGEDERSTARRSLSSDTAGAQSGLERANTFNPILEHFSGEDPSLAEDSFRPLIGQHTDQSSCLAADQRDSTMERLVGQPSAHSSMIGHPPGPAVSVSFDQGGWDSTLSRMIGRLSHQSGSHWLSGGQDFYAGQLMGQVPSEQSATWLDGGPEESRMRPLVGELDESAGQHSGSSGERTHVDLGVSTDASLPSFPAFPTGASSHSVSVHGVSPRPQNQTSPVDLGTERTEVFPDSDSFHPLLAEVTHNETADPSTIFHLPGHDEPASPAGERSVSPTNTGSSDGSEPSPERRRADESSSCVAAFSSLHESFSQLITSQCHPHESVLVVSPTTRTDVELTALSLSNLTMCDETPTVGMPQPEGATDRNISDMILEAASEKGILEQSQITLVSLADTTMEEQETCITEEEGLCEDKPSDGVREEGQKGQETEGSGSTLSPDKTPENKNRTHPDSEMLLEFQWGLSRGLQEVHQQKRRALLERSSRRVEQIKAKGALAKIQPEIRAPSEARESSKATEPQPATCKTKSEPQHETIGKSKEGQAEPHLTTVKSGFIKLKKPQLPSPVSDSRLNQVDEVDEVKSCTPEQRKRDVSKMHQRTQRLYEQLEEVKHQKAIRNRQEAYAKNRLKAREFHKKTLQKLRAKQTLQSL